MGCPLIFWRACWEGVSLYSLIGIIVFILALVATVGVHEAGHMTAAKLLKLRVPKFFVGFGKTAFSRNVKGTEYGVKWLPLGGFVEIVDDTQDEDAPERHTLAYVKPWKRQIIFSAGPLVNIVLGSLMLIGAIWSIPYTTGSNVVKSTLSCSESTYCGASEAGIVAGDKVLAINGSNVEDLDGIRELIKPSSVNVFTVERDGETFELDVAADAKTMVGMTMTEKSVDRTFTESVGTYGVMMKQFGKTMLEFPRVAGETLNLFGEKYEPDQERLSSVVKIGETYTDYVQPEYNGVSRGSNLLYLTAIFNIGLGFANLLPILPLDGGRMAVAFGDSIKNFVRRLRKKSYEPISHKYVEAFTIVAGFVVMTFAGTIILSDTIATFR